MLDIHKIINSVNRYKIYKDSILSHNFIESNIGKFSIKVHICSICNSKLEEILSDIRLSAYYRKAYENLTCNEIIIKNILE